MIIFKYFSGALLQHLPYQEAQTRGWMEAGSCTIR